MWTEDRKLKHLREAYNRYESLEELRLINKIDSPDYFIAYMDSVVLYSDPDEEISEETAQWGEKMQKVSPQYFNDAEEYIEQSYTYQELEANIDMAIDDGADIIKGMISGGEVSITGRFDQREDIRSSVTLHKIAQAVGADNITIENESGETDTTEVKRKKDIGKMPDVVYHGTSLKRLPMILSRGVRPPKKREDSNWAKLNFNPNHIFVTTKADKANFHANQASGNNEESPGIIIKLKVPDPKLLGADWDIDKEHGGSANFNDLWALPKEERAKLQKQGISASRNKGILSYAGHIPVSHILGVMGAVYDEYGEDSGPGEGSYSYYNLESVKENLKMVWDYWKDYELWENGFDWLMDYHAVREFLDDMEREEDE